MLVYIFIHLILLTIWKSIAIYEKKTREGGENIPFYYSGSLGDLFGFTFVIIAFTLIFDFKPNFLVYIIGTLSLIFTILLNLYWKQDSKRRTEIVSLYTQDGKTTLSGKLHLLYVFYIIYVELFIIIYLLFIKSNFLALIYFVFGNALYLATVIVDKIRNVI